MGFRAELTALDGTGLGQPAWRALTINRQLNGGMTCTFAVDTVDPGAKELRIGDRAVRIWEEDTGLIRFHGKVREPFVRKPQQIELTCGSPFTLLDRRQVQEPVTFVAVEQRAIVAAIIATQNARSKTRLRVSDGNLLVNGTFENDEYGWDGVSIHTPGTATIVRTTAEHRSGLAAGQITAIVNNDGRTTYFDATIGRSYTSTVWLKNGSGSGYCGVYVARDDGSGYVGQEYLINATGWTQITPPAWVASGTRGSMLIRPSAAGQIVYVDDAAVYESYTPILRDRSYEAGKSVQEIIAQLAGVIDGAWFVENPLIDEVTDDHAALVFRPGAASGTDRPEVSFEFGEGTLSNLSDYAVSESLPWNGVSAVGAQPPEPTNNLQVNPSFEDDVAGWGVDGWYSSLVASAAVPAAHGAKCAQGVVGVAGDAYIHNGGAPVDAADGLPYSATAQIRAPVSRTALMLMQFRTAADAPLASIYSDQPVMAPNAWTTLTIENQIAPAGTMKILIAIYCRGSLVGDVVYFDAVSLVQGAKAIPLVAPSTRQQDAASITRYDLLEQWVSDTDVSELPTLVGKAKDRLSPLPPLSVAITAVAGGPALNKPPTPRLWRDFDVGDTVYITIHDPPTVIEALPVRVTEATLKVSELDESEQLELVVETATFATP